MSNKVELTAVGSTINGSLSSLATISLCQPLFMLKNSLMTGRGLPRFNFTLYNGYFVNVICDQTNQPLAFTINNIYSTRILEGKTPTLIESILGGCISGTLISPLNSFCERIMIVQQLHPDPQTNKALSIEQVIQKIYRIEGVKGFVKGVVPTMIRESTNAACFFGVQKILAKEFEDVFENKEKASSLAFITAGLCAGFFTFPSDLIKTILQSNLDGKENHSFKRIRAELIKQEGSNLMKHLIKGCMARTLLMGCLLGNLGFASTQIPKYLPEMFHKHS
ncbi:MAG: MC/SLC25 family protein [Parachlamydiaceae bacterium]